MNVALVFHGHSRKFLDHLPSLEKNIINVCDCDVLINTWDRIDGGFSQSVFDETKRVLTSQDIERLSKVKNLVKLEILPEEKQLEASDMRTHFKHKCYFKAPSKFLTGVMYARKLSSLMLEEHEKTRGKTYDAVISMTMDTCVSSPINTDLLNIKGILYVTHPRLIHTHDIACGNRLVFADRETIKFWLNMYDNMNIHALSVDSRSVIMENIVARAIKHTNVPHANIDVSYDIVRMDGTRIRHEHTRPNEFVIDKRHALPCCDQ